MLTRRFLICVSMHPIQMRHIASSRAIQQRSSFSWVLGLRHSPLSGSSGCCRRRRGRASGARGSSCSCAAHTLAQLLGSRSEWYVSFSPGRVGTVLVVNAPYTCSCAASKTPGVMFIQHFCPRRVCRCAVVARDPAGGSVISLVPTPRSWDLGGAGGAPALSQERCEHSRRLRLIAV